MPGARRAVASPEARAVREAAWRVVSIFVMGFGGGWDPGVGDWFFGWPGRGRPGFGIVAGGEVGQCFA